MRSIEWVPDSDYAVATFARSIACHDAALVEQFALALGPQAYYPRFLFTGGTRGVGLDGA